MLTRRHFIKTVMMGATAATGMPGCGHGDKPSASATPGANTPPPHAVTRLHSDHFETCHAVRDGESLPIAEVKASHDVVIVGGGPSGLSAAHALRDRDLLLLEKEDASVATASSRSGRACATPQAGRSTRRARRSWWISSPRSAPRA